MRVQWMQVPGCRGLIKGLKRWDEGRWGIGSKPQYLRVYIKDPLTHLPFSHLLSPLNSGTWMTHFGSLPRV